MSDDEDQGQGGGPPWQPMFVTPEQLQQLQQQALEHQQMHHEEYRMAVDSLVHELPVDQLSTLRRMFGSVAEAGDPRALANYWEGLVQGVVNYRVWKERQDAPVTVPDEFESVALSRFGPHPFQPAFEGAECCSVCSTPPGNAAHREAT